MSTLLLVATTLQGGETTRALGLAPLVVGTDPECDLVLDDRAVSRHHARFSVTSKGVLVTDLDSKNGTSIGGTVIREGYLATSGFARIGGATLRIRVNGEPSDLPLWNGASFGGAIGGSLVMRALFAQLSRAAETNETILLAGESGTGKELLAHAIHEASARRDGPFVIFDAGAASPTLVESELFGHVRGSFTGADVDRAGLLAESDGGTLFLDEIGELPLGLQPKLLRALETRQFRAVGSSAIQTFDARVIAATHRDLRAASTAGRFRSDLYFRLAVIQARVPALRERREDIELLVERILAAQIPPRTLLDLPPGALSMLVAHDWPGNVRELKNAIARLAVLPHLESAIELQGVEGEVRRNFDAVLQLSWRDARQHIGDRFEASFLAAKLREHGGNAAKAAASMGISRQLVHRLMVRHGLRGNDDS
ncbi:MAG: sigma 54-interacting transcriptional regulator [Polyangiaceae bacterium]